MQFDTFVQQMAFRFRFRLAIASRLRKLYWQSLGASFGARTRVGRLAATWPHQIKVGQKCVLEDDIFFKYDGWWQSGPCIVAGDRVFIGSGCEFNIRKRIEIGNDCLIASGCRFIDHDHGMTVDGGPMNSLPCEDGEIELKEDVWVGVNSVVLKGVSIGQGAVVAAGAVVTKSIPPYEIWAGIPARKIGSRFGRECRMPK